MGGTRKILVIEDDDDIAEAMTDALVEGGFTVERARDGRDALSKARDLHPDAILLDLMMPVMDGFAFRKRQLEDESIAAIPVIVTSCVGERMLSQMSGVRAILRKPYETEELIAAVRR